MENIECRVICNKNSITVVSPKTQKQVTVLVDEALKSKQPDLYAYLVKHMELIGFFSPSKWDAFLGFSVAQLKAIKAVGA